MLRNHKGREKRRWGKNKKCKCNKSFSIWEEEGCLGWLSTHYTFTTGYLLGLCCYIYLAKGSC